MKPNDDPRHESELDPEDAAPEPMDSGSMDRADPQNARIAELEAERDELRDRHLRAVAELDNYRKRMQRERLQIREDGAADLARPLLDVLDNLERALQAVPAAEATGPLAEGVRMVQDQFAAALQAAGIQALDTVGKPFDPHLHEALMEVERDDVAPGTIIDELIRGYRIGERLLRAAQVRVARAPAGQSGDANPSTADGDANENAAEPAR